MARRCPPMARSSEGVWSKTFTLAADETVSFTGLPEGTTYTVSEARLHQRKASSPRSSPQNSAAIEVPDGATGCARGGSHRHQHPQCRRPGHRQGRLRQRQQRQPIRSPSASNSRTTAVNVDGDLQHYLLRRHRTQPTTAHASRTAGTAEITLQRRPDGLHRWHPGGHDLHRHRACQRWHGRR